MKVTSIRIIREDVILLLRRSGYSVVEAVEKWDNVYSAQYYKAKPGVQHTWLIGDYTIEFTKSAEITTAEIEEPSKPNYTWLALVAIALVGIGLVIINLIH